MWLKHLTVKACFISKDILSDMYQNVLSLIEDNFLLLPETLIKLGTHNIFLYDAIAEKETSRNHVLKIPGKVMQKSKKNLTKC